MCINAQWKVNIEKYKRNWKISGATYFEWVKKVESRAKVRD